MKESIYKILTQTDPSDVEFRDVVNTRKEGETLGEHMARILDVLNIEVLADREDIKSKLNDSDIVVINHPTSFDIVMIGALLATRHLPLFLRENVPPR